MMPKTKFKTVDEIPPIERGGRGSKYDEVFDAAEKAAPKAIIVADFSDIEDDKVAASKAANRASYLRDLPRADGFTVEQRKAEVFVAKN